MDDYHLQGAYDRAIEVQQKNLALLGEQVPVKRARILRRRSTGNYSLLLSTAGSAAWPI